MQLSLMDLKLLKIGYMKKFIKDVYAQGGKANNRDKDTVTYLELAVEMMERGLEFEPIDL